jgi:hypothetical protein
LLICIDFDRTYTQDPKMWNLFIDLVESRGHDIICVTLRHARGKEAEDAIRTIGRKCTVYFTERKCKKDYLQNIGIFPDIWIDDDPRTILEDF